MDCHHCGQQFTNELAALFNQARALKTKVIDYLIGRISIHISSGIPIARRSWIDPKTEVMARGISKQGLLLKNKMHLQGSRQWVRSRKSLWNMTNMMLHPLTPRLPLLQRKGASCCAWMNVLSRGPVISVQERRKLSKCFECFSRASRLTETMHLSRQTSIAGIAMQSFPPRNSVWSDLLKAADMYSCRWSDDLNEHFLSRYCRGTGATVHLMIYDTWALIFRLEIALSEVCLPRKLNLELITSFK